jgi:hypothetical protein
LQLDGALRVGQPVFGNLAQGLDDFRDLVGEFLVPVALLARLEIGGERPAAFFDEPRQIARELLNIDGADLGGDRCQRLLFRCLDGRRLANGSMLRRLARWSPHLRFLCGRTIPRPFRQKWLTHERPTSECSGGLGTPIVSARNSRSRFGHISRLT